MTVLRRASHYPPGIVAAHDPVIAVVTRGPFVEALHHGSLIITRPDGVALALGDVDSPMLARSALKPLQAVAMLEAGLDVEDELLALSTASHTGEAIHREGALRILAGTGLGPEALQTTPGLPQEPAALAQWLTSGRGPAPLAHNCSGKHAAMLRTCVRAGWPSETYLAPDHQLQLAIQTKIAELTGEEIAAPVVDGCGAPAYPTSLSGLARAFGALGSASEGPLRKLADAIRTYPEYVSGSSHSETQLHRTAAGEPSGLLAKGGAEGTLAVGLADGTGIVVKSSDGHHRAATVAMLAVLDALQLPHCATPEPVLGHGQPVGAITPSAELRQELARMFGARQ